LSRQLCKQNDCIVYGALAVLMALSVLTMNPVILISAIFAALLAAVYSRAYHIINPIMARRFGIIEMCNGYTLGNGGRAASMRREHDFIGVAVAIVRQTSEIKNGAAIFEELLVKTRVPFELRIGVVQVDRKKFTEDLETQRRIKEIELSGADPADQKKVSSVRRQISEIEHEIRSIRDGDVSLNSRITIRTSCTGFSEAAVLNDAERQISSIAEVFCAAFNMDYYIARGEILLGLL